jgi:hypothetical protein
MINATGRVFAALQVTSFPVPTFLRKHGMELQIWYGATDKAISNIYVLYPAPKIFSTKIAKRSLSSLFNVCRIEDVCNEDETQNGHYPILVVEGNIRLLFFHIPI